MRVSADRLAKGLFIAASLSLAWHPVTWLFRTWTDPTYESSGFVFVIAVLGLGVWSVTSGPTSAPAPRIMGVLLVAAAFFRFLSQTLAVNLIGGLALAMDVVALAYLAGLDRRPRSLSPVGLAGLFLFSLPLEKVVERVLGFPLQLVSAEISCKILTALFPETTCAGVRITIEGQDVLVDLPCSGASGLMLLVALFVGMTALMRPRLPALIGWGVATLSLAVVGNSLRISALALGLVRGWEVMADPIHSMIGLATLALSALPLLFLYRAPGAPVRSRARVCPLHLPATVRLPTAVAFCGLAIWIITLPKSPIDVSESAPLTPLPATIAGEVGREVPLEPIEEIYFAAFGGAAEKMQYAALGLNRVSTTSPLRHLHRPDTCLRGLGYSVRFLGTRYDGTPTSVYEAIAPDGTAWLVSATYLSDDGHAVASVGEAVWQWLNGRGHRWSSVQRITPLTLDPAIRRELETAALIALDIPVSSEEPLS